MTQATTDKKQAAKRTPMLRASSIHHRACARVWAMQIKIRQSYVSGWSHAKKEGDFGMVPPSPLDVGATWDWGGRGDGVMGCQLNKFSSYMQKLLFASVPRSVGMRPTLQPKGFASFLLGRPGRPPVPPAPPTHPTPPAPFAPRVRGPSFNARSSAFVCPILPQPQRTARNNTQREARVHFSDVVTVWTEKGEKSYRRLAKPEVRVPLQERVVKSPVILMDNNTAKTNSTGLKKTRIVSQTSCNMAKAPVETKTFVRAQRVPQKSADSFRKSGANVLEHKTIVRAQRVPQQMAENLQKQTLVRAQRVPRKEM